jgi:hypothetical protein
VALRRPPVREWQRNRHHGLSRRGGGSSGIGELEQGETIVDGARQKGEAGTDVWLGEARVEKQRTL